MAERCQRNVAVLFLDLDGSKAVNDSLGHDIGDDILKMVAQKLLTQLRQVDTVARLDGDDFVILLDNPASVGASIGIAMHSTDGHSTAQLMKCADTGMHAD